VPTFRVRKLDSSAQLPYRANPDDAGLDLHSVEENTIPPKYRGVVGTGLAIEIPRGYAGFVVPRSGLAAKKGVSITNAPGLIDSGYRGEVKVILENLSDAYLVVNYGDRIAQLVIVEVPSWEPIEVEALSDTERGRGGFGSTGT
jgi:dUTP pyrophosphatase